MCFAVGWDGQSAWRQTRSERLAMDRPDLFRLWEEASTCEQIQDLDGVEGGAFA
jgi:hypothetical protein